MQSAARRASSDSDALIFDLDEHRQGVHQHEGDLAMEALICRVLDHCSPFKSNAWWLTPARVTGQILGQLNVYKLYALLHEHRLLCFQSDAYSDDDMEDAISRWALAMMGDHDKAGAWLRAGCYWPDAALSLETEGFDPHDASQVVDLDAHGGPEEHTLGYWVASGTITAKEALQYVEVH